jgi:dihydrofolate synthase/folylpolyglutamate synthase
VRGLEELLATREAFGVRLGTERMEAVLAALGDPQRRFRAIHVVGTNGKTSTARFCAAMLGAQGLAAGAYLSPHVQGFAERVQLDGEPLGEDLLAAAVERVEAVAPPVERAAGEPLTQFEALTAAAFEALATAGAEVVAVEAGLGGRYDATNVLGAPVVLCTSVGLDHTAQLGPTREAIAGEKLAVVRPGARVVCGEADAEIAPVLERLAREHGAAEVLLLPPGVDVPDAPPLASPGAFQRANLAVALAGCERLPGVGLDRGAALRAAAAVRVPGRLETVGTAPLTVLDGAHNPHAAAALAAELPALLGGRRPRVLVVAILADKDADGVLRELAPHVDVCVATQTGSPRARPAAELAARAEAVGLPAVVEPDPTSAVARARADAGPDGAVLVTGSLSLLADLAAEAATRGGVRWPA